MRKWAPCLIDNEYREWLAKLEESRGFTTGIRRSRPSCRRFSGDGCREESGVDGRSPPGPMASSRPRKCCCCRPSPANDNQFQFHCISVSLFSSRFHPSSVQLISLNLPSQSTALATRVSRLIDAFMPLRPLAGATVDAPNSTASLSGRWPHREFMFAYHHHHIIIIIIIHSLIRTYIYINKYN